jgi:hypothetical protein
MVRITFHQGVLKDNKLVLEKEEFISIIRAYPDISFPDKVHLSLPSGNFTYYHMPETIVSGAIKVEIITEFPFLRLNKMSLDSPLINDPDIPC